MINAFLFALVVAILLHGIVSATLFRKQIEMLEAVNNALERIAAKLEKNAESTD